MDEYTFSLSRVGSVLAVWCFALFTNTPAAVHASDRIHWTAAIHRLLTCNSSRHKPNQVQFFFFSPFFFLVTVKAWTWNIFVSLCLFSSLFSTLVYDWIWVSVLYEKLFGFSLLLLLLNLNLFVLPHFPFTLSLSGPTLWISSEAAVFNNNFIFHAHPVQSLADPWKTRRERSDLWTVCIHLGLRWLRDWARRSSSAVFSFPLANCYSYTACCSIVSKS